MDTCALTLKEGESNMSNDDFIPMDGLGNVKEAGLIETEDIYPLIVKSAERKTHANGKNYIQVIVEVQGQEESVQGIFNNLWLPMDGDEDKAREFKMLMIRRFCAAFEIPTDEGVNVQDFVGAQADLPVVKVSYKDKTTKVERFKNEIIIPNLPQE